MLTVAIPDQYIRYLGVLPMLIGVWHLSKNFRVPARESESQIPGIGSVFSVALVTMANGGDNIAAYVPLFGHQTAAAIAATCVMFAVMTAIWCGVRIGLIAHPRLGAAIRR